MGVIAEATAETEDAVNRGNLLPYDDHFHPSTLGRSQVKGLPESRRLGQPLVATNIIPYENQVRTTFAA